MIRFLFESIPLDGGPIHGLDQGHITVKGNLGTASSREIHSSMMIFVSAFTFLYELQQYLEDARAKIYCFTGVGSLFQLEFHKEGDEIAIRHGDQAVSITHPRLILQSLLNAVSEFSEASGLPPDDVCYEDLRRTLSDVERFNRTFFGVRGR